MKGRKLLFIFFKTKMTDTTPTPIPSEPIAATPIEATPVTTEGTANKEIALGDIPTEGIETTPKKKI